MGYQTRAANYSLTKPFHYNRPKWSPKALVRLLGFLTVVVDVITVVESDGLPHEATYRCNTPSGTFFPLHLAASWSKLA